MSAGYELRPLDLSEAGLRDCEALLRRVFSTASHLTKDYLDWEYNQNPAGRAIGFNAYRGESLAAHYVTIPMAARLDGDSHVGMLSLNAATHPEHRGRKLFTRLAEKTYDAAAGAGYSFVIGVANASSTHGFIRTLGHQLIGPLDARLGFGRPARERRTEGVGFERVWDRDSLRWRLSNPSTGYRVVSGGSRFRVESATERHGIKALLGEFSEDLRPGHIEKRGLGFRPITLWIGFDPAIRWSRSLYLDIPAPFRRSPLNLHFKLLKAGGTSLRRDEVRFQALDFDAY